MAMGSLGALNTQRLTLELSQMTKLCFPSLPHIVQAVGRPKTQKYTGIRVPPRSKKGLIVCDSHSSLVTETELAASRIDEGGEKRAFSNPVSQLIPSSDEVKYLLTEICDTTSISEFDLKLDGFHLHVTRALAGDVYTPFLPPSLPGSAAVTAEVPTSNSSESTSALAIVKAGFSEGDAGTLQERAADEGLVIIQSPKVGFFRRSRTIKGKRAPPSCKEKQIVKEGQVICYIEQLGGEIPVESDVSGEVIKILHEDGEPVGYGDAIIAILPSFPGI